MSDETGATQQTPTEDDQPGPLVLALLGIVLVIIGLCSLTDLSRPLFPPFCRLLPHPPFWMSAAFVLAGLVVIVIAVGIRTFCKKRLPTTAATAVASGTVVAVLFYIAPGPRWAPPEVLALIPSFLTVLLAWRAPAPELTTDKDTTKRKVNLTAVLALFVIVAYGVALYFVSPSNDHGPFSAEPLRASKGMRLFFAVLLWLAAAGFTFTTDLFRQVAEQAREKSKKDGGPEQGGNVEAPPVPPSPESSG